LSFKGAEAVTNLIKFQKIQRFSEAWTRSLRYQNVDAESFPGLRKIMLNNNPRIADDGLELLTEPLREDVWIKDIEMQNCGIGDEGAQSIIKCLNINKTILNFNIAGNPEVPEHLHRHIIVHLGNADQDSSDSGESKSTPEKITKSQLLEKLKFIEEQLDAEIFRRKQMEQLNEQLHNQVMECQKEINFQGSFKIPDGFTLITNETLDKLLKE
jgi:centrosomal protein CEP78